MSQNTSATIANKSKSLGKSGPTAVENQNAGRIQKIVCRVTALAERCHWRTERRAESGALEVGMTRCAPVISPTVTAASPPHHLRLLSALLLSLAGAAGYVDAVGYLAFDHIFVANMTGNSVLLGIAAVEGHTDATLRSVLALLGFLVGATLGTTLTDARKAEGLWPALVTAALAIEGAVLVAIAVAWGWLPHGNEATLRTLVFGTGVAMGLQSAAARKLAVPGVSTVVLTSTLTSFVARVGAHVRHRKWTDPTPRDPTQGPGILFGVWGAYVVGAGLGAWVTHVSLSLAMVLPAALVSFVTLAALRAFHGTEDNEHVGR